MGTLIKDIARSIALPPLKRVAGLASRLVPIPQPTLLVGPGASERLGALVASFAHRRILIVTDASIVRLGLMASMLGALATSGTAVVLFDGVTADAPIPMIEAGLARYRAEACDAIIAFGGGSVIDTAKAIGLAATNARPLRDVIGFFRCLHAPAALYAVPTTAGTGSEVTVVAVVSDPEGRRKRLIVDPRLVPRVVALDPSLMTRLPPAVTAATGMDALTHAVEAFIGQWSSETSDRMALAAVALIYANLPTAVARGGDLAAREHMALAATYAGLAFTRANVGNVHAIAHQLGARYHTPHGLANAILLPHVLRFSADAAAPRLALLARCASVAGAARDDTALARRFIDSVQTLNETIGIPARLDALREEDIAALARDACSEADVLYPVPRAMSQRDCEALLRRILPERAPTPVARRRARASATTAARRAADIDKH